MKKILIVLLFVIGCLVFMYTNKYKSELKIKEEISNIKINEQILISNFCINQEILCKNSNHKIANEFLVTDELSTNKNLLELIDNTKIVFRFSVHNCESCINAHINLVASMIKKYGQENFFVIGDFANRRMLKVFKQSYNIDFPIYCSPKLIPGVDRYNLPYYFVLKQSGEIDMLHITDKGSFDFTKEYFEIVNDRFFSPYNKKQDNHFCCDNH